MGATTNICQSSLVSPSGSHWECSRSRKWACTSGPLLGGEGPGGGPFWGPFWRSQGPQRARGGAPGGWSSFCTGLGSPEPWGDRVLDLEICHQKDHFLNGSSWALSSSVLRVQAFSSVFKHFKTFLFRRILPKFASSGRFRMFLFCFILLYPGGPLVQAHLRHRDLCLLPGRTGNVTGR